MLLPNANQPWKAAGVATPHSRPTAHYVTRARLLIVVLLIGGSFLLWRGLNEAAEQMQRFYCWGPATAPVDMTSHDQARWHAHLQTPVLFNHHTPLEINASTIQHIDLNPLHATPSAAQNAERVLILTPLRDAAAHLPHYFDLLSLLTYPHHLIDLAFVVGDSADDTLAVLAAELDRVQSGPADMAFRSALIVEKDVGAVASQDVEDRHSWAAQAPRRRLMARARNYLLANALRPDHAWVYWRDVDIQESPASIIEDFVAHDRDVLVPNVWFHRYEMQHGRLTDIEGRCMGALFTLDEQRFVLHWEADIGASAVDYNSWQETPQSLRLANKLDKSVILAEGYDKVYKTGRTHMARMGDWRNDKDEEMPLDGIGGVSILVKADVHRSGVNFPCYAFENQAETEGFAKMARRAGYGVYGLPNYIVWHVDTEEKPGNS